MAEDNPNRLFADWILVRTIQLQAVASWMLAELLVSLRDLEAEIVAEISKVNPTATQSLSQRKARLQHLLDEIEQRIKDVYAEMEARAGDYFQELADIEADEQRDKLALIFGVAPVGGRIKLSDILTLSIIGATLGEWFESMQTDYVFRMRTILVQGVGAGLSLDDILGTMRGISTPIPLPSPTTTASRSLETVLRTGVEEVSDEVLSRTAERMPAKTIRMGWQSIAVLDSRTTQLCRAYAFKIWTLDHKPIGHSLPFLPVPRHYNCRSRIIPIHLDDDPVNDLTFKQWLDSLSVADQNKIFGETRMRLYREGKITEADLIRQQERSISLDDLRQEGDPRNPND
jgi:hypothetical protein